MANKRRNKAPVHDPNALLQKYDSIAYKNWIQYTGGHRARGKIKRISTQRLRNKLKLETKKAIEDGND